MVKVIGVRFRTAGKIYFFDPGRLNIKKGDHVIVETARGIEYGTVVGGVMPQMPMPPTIFVSSLTPIWRNSILVLNTDAKSFTSSRKSILPSAVK